MLPQAILFDLDDTLIQAYGGAEAAWLVVTHELADDLAPLTPNEVAGAVGAFARNFWADPERHRLWRIRMGSRGTTALGIFAIWFDAAGKGLPRDTHIMPDRIVVFLSGLLSTETVDGA